MRDAGATAADQEFPTSEKRGSNALELESVSQTYRVNGQDVRALDRVSLTLRKGETLGLVGESGCGKSSLARAIIGIPKPSSGQVYLNGTEMSGLKGQELRRVRRGVQMVFQDPASSLDPLWTVGRAVAEPLQLQGGLSKKVVEARVRSLLEQVHLPPAEFEARAVRRLSGGQAQRVAIARALAVDPELVIWDEAVSSLDVSVQAQILNMLVRLRGELELTSLFISHDLAVVRYVADRIGVMYLGRLVEIGDTEAVLAKPQHPYTAALVASAKRPATDGQPSTPRLSGEVPSPIDPPSGCHFRTRCPIARDLCAVESPALVSLDDGSKVACHFPLGRHHSLPR